MNGLLCSGNVHAAILNDDGSFAGFFDIKNAIKLALNPGEGEEKQRQSRMNANYRQVLDSVVLPGIPSVGLDFDDGDAETVGMAFLGTLSAVNLVQQNRAGVAMTVTALDRWLELGDRYINSVGFSLVDEAEAALGAGIDYVVDLPMGLIKFLSTGSVSVNDVVEKTYTTRAVTGTRISGSKRSQLKMRLLMNGKNLATGLPVVVDIPVCTLRPTGEVDVLSGEFAVTSLTGTIVGDYTIDYLKS